MQLRASAQQPVQSCPAMCRQRAGVLAVYSSYARLPVYGMKLRECSDELSFRT